MIVITDLNDVTLVSDESSTDEDVEEDEGEVHPSNDTNEQGKYYIKAGFSRSLFGSL